MRRSTRPARSSALNAFFAATLALVLGLDVAAQENPAGPGNFNPAATPPAATPAGTPAPAIVVPQVITLEAVAGEGGGIVFSATPPEGQGFVRINSGAIQFGGAGGGFGGGLGGNWGGGWVPQDDLGLLAMEQYHDDIGLIPEQKDRLAIVRRDLQEQRAKAFADIRTMEPAKIAEVAQQTESRLKEESQRRVTEILLPHQVERLKQMRVQLQMRSRGAGALANGELANTLGLTDDQKKRLAEKQREAELELRRKVEELRKQLVKDIVQEVLTAEQRESLAKLVGGELQAKSAEPAASGSGTGTGTGAARPRGVAPTAP